jgi:hypothetical protein
MHLSYMPISIDYSSCTDMFLKLSLQSFIMAMTYNGFLGMFLKLSLRSFIIAVTYNGLLSMFWPQSSSIALMYYGSPDVFETLSLKLQCWCNLFWSFGLLGVSKVLFNILVVFFVFLKSMLAFLTSGCAFFVLVVLSQWVCISTCALEVHVGLHDFFSMFLRWFYICSSFNDPRSCFPLVLVLVMTTCISHI